MPDVRKLYSTLLLLSALVFAEGASATPITANAGWYGFCFGDVGSPATAGCQNEGVGAAGNPFTVNLLEAGIVKVTDAFWFGDIFDVYIDSLFSFTTSTPGTGLETADPDIAFTGGFYSAGSALVAAGTHTIDIITNTSPFGAGAAYIEVVSERVPVPATLYLVGVSLLGFGCLRRKLA